MNSIRARKTRFTLVRWFALAAVLLYITWEFFAHALVSKTHPSVHALCPFGGIESLLRYISEGGRMLPKVFSGTMGLFFVSLGTALLFKRSFCGQVCPLGTLQELSGNLGRKILGPKRFVIPVLADRILRYLKYIILALAVYMAWTTGTLWIQSFDPWPAYAHIFSPDELFPTYAIGLVILILSLVASFFYERVFCKYLCPMGAMVAIAGLVSPFKVRRDSDACINCGLCDRVCPVNIQVSKASAILDAECISCGKCAAVCPAPKALDTGFAKKYRFDPAVAVAFGAGAFFLFLFVFNLIGFDRFSGMQEATLREMAKSAGISTGEFKAQFGLPKGLFDGTRSSAVEEALPLSKMAELNGMDAVTLKTSLGLDPALADSTSWGEAYGSVKLSKIAEMNGLTVEDFKTRFSLKANVTGDTPWREIKRAVEAILEKQQTGGGGGGGGGGRGGGGGGGHGGE